MEILQTSVMRGPNYWSNYRKQLIVVKIELKEADILSQTEVEGIGEKLETLEPFFYNLKSYKSVLDIVAQIAVEIQNRAGMDCAYSRIYPAMVPNQAIITFSYTAERAGIYAANAAVNLVNSLIANAPYALERDIHNLKRINERYRLEPQTQAVADKALALNIPVRRLDKTSLLLGWGCKQYVLKNGEAEMPSDQAIGRIPVVAVTGTNGKTTTTRLIAHLAKVNGCRVGFTTTDGIYLQGELVTVGDCSGPMSAAVVLKDPQINYAVLECARGGILRAGLGFDQCDISVVTNISGDHLGMDNIQTLEQLARVKLTVAKSTKDEGYAILNADDDLVYHMKDSLSCKIALFSMDPLNPRTTAHCAQGGLVFNHRGWLFYGV